MFVISPLWHPFSIFPRQILPFRSLFLSKPTCRFFSFVCGKAAQIEQQTEQRPRWPPPLLQFPLSSTFLLTLKWLWGPSLLSLPSHPLVSTFATRRSRFPKRKSNAKSLMPLRKVFYRGCIFQMHFDAVCTVLPRERAHWDNTNKQRTAVLTDVNLSYSSFFYSNKEAASQKFKGMNNVSCVLKHQYLIN